MATSFALASNASSAKPSGWVEGLVLPSAVPGSGECGRKGRSGTVCYYAVHTGACVGPELNR